MIQVISRGHTACHRQNLVLATGIWFLGNCCHSTFLLGIVRPRQGEEDFLWSANGTTFSSNDMLIKLSPSLAPDAYHGFKQHEWKPLQVGTVLGVSLSMLPRSPTPSLIAWSHLGLHHVASQFWVDVHLICCTSIFIGSVIILRSCPPNLLPPDVTFGRAIRFAKGDAWRRGTPIHQWSRPGFFVNGPFTPTKSKLKWGKCWQNTGIGMI